MLAQNCECDVFLTRKVSHSLEGLDRQRLFLRLKGNIQVFFPPSHTTTAKMPYGPPSDVERCLLLKGLGRSHLTPRVKFLCTLSAMPKHSFATLLCYRHSHLLSCFDISCICLIDAWFWCVQLRLGKARVQYLNQFKTAQLGCHLGFKIWIWRLGKFQKTLLHTTSWS